VSKIKLFRCPQKQNFIEIQHGICNRTLSEQNLDTNEICHYAKNVTDPWNNSLKPIRNYFYKQKRIKEDSESQNKTLA